MSTRRIVVAVNRRVIMHARVSPHPSKRLWPYGTS
jgi:hypothetical protein